MEHRPYNMLSPEEMVRMEELRDGVETDDQNDQVEEEEDDDAEA